MVRIAVFPDTTTRNRPYSVFWLSKRPRKWPTPLFSRTLRQDIGPTAYSGCRSVHENGLSAGFPGRYDTESALQRILAVIASVEMAFPLISPDTTTRNRPYSVFWMSKRPLKWSASVFFPLFLCSPFGLHYLCDVMRKNSFENK